MSDTDTDDTDLLLLVPPNYYTQTAERLLQEVKMDTAAAASAAADALVMPPPPVPTTAAYQFLPPSKKSELNQINARLQNIELDGDDKGHFDVPSDISTISTNTVRTTAGTRLPKEFHGVVHSTPKGGSVEPPRPRLREDNILLEIDHYLDENNTNRWQQQPHHHQHHSDEHLRNFRVVHDAHPAATSLPSIRMTSTSASIEAARLPRGSLSDNNKLISLSDLWGKSCMGGTVIANNTPNPLLCSPSLKEEQLRRHHLEKTVQTLQSQLLEYQQRISVAMEVDRSKDEALNRAEQAAANLNFEVQQLRDVLHRLEAERSDSHGKMEALQHELAQAVGLATKFQERHEKMEADLDRHQQEAKEWDEKLEQLEMQLHGSKRAEELSHAELNKLRDKFAKVDYQQEKLKAHIEELETENTTLRHQKEMLQDYHQKQKSRADSLETQRKSMQETLANLTEVETNLKKKLEIQQKSMKQHYQQQMENVVAKKMQEFQNQLDKSEENLKSEARDRERLIAERAVKQLEMINEKNNQELNLIQEKHDEEVELYRLQLGNASKKIDELELKLSFYKNKRADIAEKLHGVMEAQWQQALAILTSPTQNSLMPASDTDSESPELNNARVYPETPRTSKSQRSNNTEKNNLDSVGKRDPPSPMDKLAAYIELLLSKSPSDFDKLDEILALTAKKGSKPSKRNGCGSNKAPPWKC
ncbi:ankyrin repeat domain-containing protein 26 [Drosophila miranda]|uniref:ankyrin repeat domain-containing protein 26 n=1 Tax=Drosophila miranda TaxID=7229 RepID=UPI0007E67C75|nr:ankyrin repeat domain-containing protein 26 [Drosophila miranda]